MEAATVTPEPWRMDMRLVTGLKMGGLSGWWFPLPQSPSLGNHLLFLPRVAHNFAQSRSLNIC